VHTKFLTDQFFVELFQEYSISPFQVFLARWLPQLITSITQRFFRDAEHARNSLLRLSKKWAEPDRKCLQDENVINLMVASLVEAFHQGAKGGSLGGNIIWKKMGFQNRRYKIFTNLSLAW
jgi:hypothetical protein